MISIHCYFPFICLPSFILNFYTLLSFVICAKFDLKQENLEGRRSKKKACQISGSQLVKRSFGPDPKVDTSKIKAKLVLLKLSW